MFKYVNSDKPIVADGCFHDAIEKRHHWYSIPM